MRRKVVEKNLDRQLRKTTQTTNYRRAVIGKTINKTQIVNTIIRVQIRGQIGTTTNLKIIGGTTGKETNPRNLINKLINTTHGSSNNNDTTPHALNQMQGNEESLVPYIRCVIEGEEVELLVDTGAIISVLAKEIVDTIIKKDLSIPQLPTTGVRISNAVGKPICKISKQIFCQCQLNGGTIHANFIQVEGLNERGIIGADILNQHNTQINFSNYTIVMKIKGRLHSIPFSKKNFQSN